MSALRLIIMRHAKSAWGNPSLSDHDRPLNDRGRKACTLLGPWLAEHEYLPDPVPCSRALRTKDTRDGSAPYLPEADIRYDRALYLAEPEALRAALDRATADCVITIAHNPGIAAFAAEMAMAAPAHPRFGNYPTGATTVLDFKARDWGAVTPASGTVVDFVVPRDLPGP